MLKTYLLQGVKTPRDARRAEEALYGTGIVLWANADPAAGTVLVFLPDGVFDEHPLFCSAEASGFVLKTFGEPNVLSAGRSGGRVKSAVLLVFSLLIPLLFQAVLPHFPRFSEAVSQEEAKSLTSLLTAALLLLTHPALYAKAARCISCGVPTRTVFYALAFAASSLYALLSGASPLHPALPAALFDLDALLCSFGRDASDAPEEDGVSPRFAAAHLTLAAGCAAALLFVSKDLALGAFAAEAILLAACVCISAERIITKFKGGKNHGLLEIRPL